MKYLLLILLLTGCAKSAENRNDSIEIIDAYRVTYPSGKFTDSLFLVLHHTTNAKSFILYCGARANSAPNWEIQGSISATAKDGDTIRASKNNLSGIYGKDIHFSVLYSSGDSTVAKVYTITKFIQK